MLNPLLLLFQSWSVLRVRIPFDSLNVVVVVQVLATCFIRKLMDQIFTPQELYWLDDILPGTKVGRIRRYSAARRVQMPKSGGDDADETKVVSASKWIRSTECRWSGEMWWSNLFSTQFQPPLDSSSAENSRGGKSANLLSITEVSRISMIDEAQFICMNPCSECFRWFSAWYLDFSFSLDFKRYIDENWAER